MSKGTALLATLQPTLRAFGIEGLSHELVHSENNLVFGIRAEHRPGQADHCFAHALIGHRRGYRTADQVEFTQGWVSTLSAFGLPVPKPRKTLSNDWIYLDAEGCVWSLNQWHDGQVMRPLDGMGVEQAYKLGQVLARVHAASPSHSSTGVLPDWTFDSITTESSPFKPGPLSRYLTTEQLSLFQEVRTRSHIQLHAWGEKRDRRVLIHGDFILANVKFAAAGPIVMDFDDCGYGNPILDIGAMVTNISEWSADKALTEELRAGFFAGYFSIAPPSIDLAAKLPILAALRHARCCLWEFGRANLQSQPIDDHHIRYRLREIRSCLSTNG